MSDDFDPYLEWFGIEPDEHPVDFYRLVGAERFEEDLELLDSAVQSHMERLHALQSGPRGRHTQEILNELAQAKLIFSDVDRKRIYDDDLEISNQDDLVLPSQVADVSDSAKSEDESEDLVIPTAATDCVTPRLAIARDADQPVAQRAYKPRTKGNNKPLVVFMGLGLVVGVSVLIWSTMSLTGDSSEEESEKESQNQVAMTEKTESNSEDTDVADEVSEALARQEGNGEVTFVLALAKRSKGVALTTVDSKDRLTGWSKQGDTIVLDFHIAKPGAFTLLIEYEVPEDAAGGEMQLKLNDGNPRTFSLRKDIIEGQIYTDEISVFITSNGKQQFRLAVAVCHGEALMDMVSLKLIPN